MATFKFIFRSDVQFNVVATNAVGASPAGPNSPIYSVIGKSLMHLINLIFLTSDNIKFQLN